MPVASSAEHLIATKALRCTATAWMLIVAQCSAIPRQVEIGAVGSWGDPALRFGAPQFMGPGERPDVMLGLDSPSGERVIGSQLFAHPYRMRRLPPSHFAAVLLKAGHGPREPTQRMTTSLPSFLPCFLLPLPLVVQMV